MIPRGLDSDRWYIILCETYGCGELHLFRFGFGLLVKWL
jgi:hypothetical protein